MDKHVIQTREEQLDWVENLQPTHINTNQHEIEVTGNRVASDRFESRSVFGKTLVVSKTGSGKTRVGHFLNAVVCDGREVSNEQ
ncbi:hypothetical protein [Cellvibrio sp. PSBB023]|uniref:hypothetical protein n=1 Tax=Cellvibrio sp. PSBB023 TaxID=1945512 RepID=UPI000990127A|nr:hypothetical protein [Cellvibrio sp. PSBB023]AQT61841.1 hypothetical protein B0D95_18355 [Cellvibrio sp. PSBB023]